MDMEYELLIKEIKRQCVRKHISIYRLSKLSGVPQSTIYGVLKDKNKAQMDTLCELLKALQMKIVLLPADEETETELSPEQDFGIWELPEEKRELMIQLIQWLRE